MEAANGALSAPTAASPCEVMPPRAMAGVSWARTEMPARTGPAISTPVKVAVPELVLARAIDGRITTPATCPARPVMPSVV